MALKAEKANFVWKVNWDCHRIVSPALGAVPNFYTLEKLDLFLDSFRTQSLPFPKADESLSYHATFAYRPIIVPLLARKESLIHWVQLQPQTNSC